MFLAAFLIIALRTYYPRVELESNNNCVIYPVLLARGLRRDREDILLYPAFPNRKRLFKRPFPRPRKTSAGSWDAGADVFGVILENYGY
jgi:hypothetical protein